MQSIFKTIKKRKFIESLSLEAAGSYLHISVKLNFRLLIRISNSFFNATETARRPLIYYTLYAPLDFILNFENHGTSKLNISINIVMHSL